MDVDCEGQFFEPKAADFDPKLIYKMVMAASSGVWDVPSLRPMQMNTARVMLNPHRPNQIIIVEPTGGGKTHVLCLVGVIEKGMTLIFIPLLALSADVMKKFGTANQRWGTVDVQHIDELHDTNKPGYLRLLERIRGMTRRTTSSLFLFVSPHFLVEHPEAAEALLDAARMRTLRLVATDEMHLLVQQGLSFRKQIRALRDVFWLKLFRGNPDFYPKFVGTTATMPVNYINHFTTLTTLPFPDENIFRASHYDFAQREIAME